MFVEAKKIKAALPAAVLMLSGFSGAAQAAYSVAPSGINPSYPVLLGADTAGKPNLGAIARPRHADR